MAERITVKSGELRGRQQEWLLLVKRAREAFTENIVETQNMTGFFEGNPVRELRREFLLLHREGEDAFEKLGGHIHKLSEIASIYEAAERSNVNVTADH